MFGPREMLLSSEEPVVRQFLNAQRQGPIGMAEEKDADELAQEQAEGHELPPLPPIPLQLTPSDGSTRRSAREPGAWCRENGVTPPPGSFESQTAAPGEVRREEAGEPEPARGAHAAPAHTSVLGGPLEHGNGAVDGYSPHVAARQDRAQ
jgi:phospholipid/cholesterol/gamma-HCH transport system ATP-binding protein